MINDSYIIALSNRVRRLVAGDPNITALVEQSDTLVLLGVIPSDTNLGISRRKIDLRRCVQVRDGQVSLGFHTYSKAPISALMEPLQRNFESRSPPERVAPLEPRPRCVADDQPLTPDDVAAGVNAFWDRREPLVITADIGDCLFTAMRMDQAALAAPGYYASMGFAVPGGLDVQVASGKRPLIMVGDGSFQMTGWELGNVARYG